MNEKLSSESQRLLSFAQKEAVRCRASHVGVEHLLLAIVQEGRSAAADLLRELGINLERIRQEIEWRLPPTVDVVRGRMDYSAQTLRTLQNAGSLAREEIGSEHLLLAITKEPEGIAPEVLSKLGVRYENLLEALDSGDR